MEARIVDALPSSDVVAVITRIGATFDPTDQFLEYGSNLAIVIVDVVVFVIVDVIFSVLIGARIDVERGHLLVRVIEGGVIGLEGVRKVVIGGHHAGVIFTAPTCTRLEVPLEGGEELV